MARRVSLLESAGWSVAAVAAFIVVSYGLAWAIAWAGYPDLIPYGLGGLWLLVFLLFARR